MRTPFISTISLSIVIFAVWALMPHTAAARVDAEARFRQLTKNLRAEEFTVEQPPDVIAGAIPSEFPEVPPDVIAGATPRQFPAIGAVVGAAPYLGPALGGLVVGAFVGCEADLDCTVEAVTSVFDATGDIIEAGVDLFNRVREAVDEALDDDPDPRPRDPQIVTLFQTFVANGQDQLQDLVAFATAPENVVLKDRVPGFLGGSTFIGSSAFSGQVLDANGQEVPGTSVLFGVFRLDDGREFFAPILFLRNWAVLPNITTVIWELDPIFTEGSFTAVIERVFVQDASPSR